MEAIFWYIFWGAVCYFYAKDTKEQYPDIDMNPFNYIIGGALFGLLSWLWAWNKKRNYKKYRR